MLLLEHVNPLECYLSWRVDGTHYGVNAPAQSLD